MLSTVMALTFGLTVLIGVPIAFSLGLTAVVYIVIWGEVPLTIVAQRMFSGMDSFPLLAVPFFILSGELMSQGGIMAKLVAFSNALVGHIRGGLAQVNVVGSMFSSGITGAGVADAAAVGSVLIPAMKREGYDPAFSAAVTAAAAVNGPIIPPSIAMVIYSFAVGGSVSVAALFAAGFLPGLLIGLGLMAQNYVIARKQGRKGGAPFELRRVGVEFKRAFLALMMPVIILGGILGGICTATEAAAVAVFYAALIGFFITRQLTMAAMPRIMVRTAVTTSVVLLLMATGRVISWLLSAQEIPAGLASFMTSLTDSRMLFLILCMIFLLVVGCLLDASAALIMLVPILAPIAVAYDVHPLHFALLVIVNLSIGMITPPVGVLLFVTCGIAKVSMEAMLKVIWPYVIMQIALLFVIAFIPEITLVVPRWLGYL